jgi:uncharacterized protein YneF (UPF0154 family)
MTMHKEALYTNIQSAVGDFAAQKYQIQWQRISQMQQNASILLAIITFSVTLLFQIINIEKFGKPILENSLWNFVLLPGIFSSLLIGIISGFFLFKVIMPKTIYKDLPLPSDLYKELVEKIEKKVVKIIPDDLSSFSYDTVNPIRFMAAEIADRYKESILEINDIVENNQQNYTKGLIISIFSIFINILIYSQIMLDFILINAVLIIWYGVCLAFFIFSLLFAFIYKINNRGCSKFLISGTASLDSVEN